MYRVDGALALRTPRSWVDTFLHLDELLWHRKAPPLLPPTVIHYFRSPKTGSSALLERLIGYHSGVRRRPHRVEGVHEFELQCLSSTTSRLQIHVHDHGGGCRNDVCNASAFLGGNPSFTVLREPCDRFASVLDELVSRRDARLTAQEMGGVHFDSLTALVDFVEDLLSGCPSSDVACAVRKIDQRVMGPSRIFLYPQALYVAAQRTAESIVCYKSSSLGAELDIFLARQTGCRAGAEPVGRMHTNRTTWSVFADLRQRNVRGPPEARGRFWGPDRRPDPRALRPGSHLTRARSNPTAAAATEAALMAHTCQRIRSLYARDTELWTASCSRSRVHNAV